MPYVCREDGAIQCEGNTGASLAETRSLLEALIAGNNVKSGETRSRIVPSACGFPSGVYHRFEITEEGYKILFFGFAGPQGFYPCSDQAMDELGVQTMEKGGLADMFREGTFTSAGYTPVLVRELIGRPVRVYNPGDALTKDLRPERVNIEVSKSGNTILKIWFG